MPKERRKDRATANGANLGFEEKLWAAADKLRDTWMQPSTNMLCLG